VAGSVFSCSRQPRAEVYARFFKGMPAHCKDYEKACLLSVLPPGLLSESVLVETFEPGQSVAHYLRNPHPRNGEVCPGY
jgi:hypothetical protein